MQDSPEDRLISDAEHAADLIRSAKDVQIVSHIDADGITSAAIAATTCQRLNKPFEVLFAKKMDEDTVDFINGCKKDLVWVCDLGSGYLTRYSRDGLVITDHHVPEKTDGAPMRPRITDRKKKQLTLDSFFSEPEPANCRMAHVNPHVHGMDGSREICGAGVTYLTSRAVDPRNTDLAYLGIVGACGDIQDGEGGLVSVNRTVLRDAVSEGDVMVEEDLRLFGKETRTLIQFLQYCSDPQLRGLSENGAACARFYSDLDIPVKDGRRYRCWNDLTPDEKERAVDALMERVDPEDADRMTGESYTLPKNQRHCELRDAKEYATLLNACGRYEDAETGMRICMGYADALAQARKNRTEHKHNISAALSLVKDRDMVHTRQFIQWFDAGSEIKETVVGIVAGMVLGSEMGCRNMPMIAFADADDGVKVSARADRSLVSRGLNLSAVMKTAAEVVGGYGGGHNVAAGATIPPDKKEEFLDAVDDLVAAQVI